MTLIMAFILLTATALPELQVVDDTGQTVTVAGATTRIISLSPHATELVYAAGAGSQLVAAAEFSDYPTAARKLPRVGGIGGLDRERILLLQPDLVVAWASGNKAGDLRWLHSQDIPVYLSEPEKLNDIADSIEKLGKITGNYQVASIASHRFRVSLQNSCTPPGEQQLKSVYYEVWPSPAMTIGGHHWLNEVLQEAGLRNVFADQSRTVLSVEAESVFARPASVSISSFPARDNRRPEQVIIQNNPLLARPGPRITEAIEWLCQHH